MTRVLIGTLAMIAVSLTAVVPAQADIWEIKRVRIDFTNPEDAAGKAHWAQPQRIDVTDQGLGWDGSATGVRDGWIQTKPIPLGYAWRAPYAASISVFVRPSGPPVVEGPQAPGEGVVFHGGSVYVRHSPDLVNWSSWQALTTNASRFVLDDLGPGWRYGGSVRVPYREREAYTRWLRSWHHSTSNEEAIVKNILKIEPDFFARQIPFIGYVEFLMEHQFRGGQRIESLHAEINWAMSGIGSPGWATPWRFDARPAPQDDQPRE